MAARVILRTVICISCLLLFITESIHAADYPLPFDQMKEVVMAEGEKGDDGKLVLKKQVTGIEYWMIYFPDDGSIAFGKATSPRTYSWGILYDLEGKFLFLETFLGQVVNLHYVEAEGAIEVGNQFIKDLEGWAEDSTEKPTEASWVIT